MAHVLSRMLQRQPPPPVLREAAGRSSVEKLHALLLTAFELAAEASGVQDEDGLQGLLQSLLAKLRELPPDGIMFLPGGWRGQLGSGWVMHVLERSSDGESFSLTASRGTMRVDQEARGMSLLYRR